MNAHDAWRNAGRVFRSVAIVVVALSALSTSTRAEGPKVTVKFTDKGELSITLDGKPISQPTTKLEPTVRFRDPAAVVPFPWGADRRNGIAVSPVPWKADELTWPVVDVDCLPKKSVFDAKGQRLTHTHEP